MAFDPKDFYFKKAKKQNFVARSIFKLEEIDKKYKIIRKGDFILDLGCAPGSWAQYASKKIQPNGKIVGVDLTQVALALPNTIFIQGDVFEQNFEDTFDVVLSDMAPKTTGVRITDQTRSFELACRALELAKENLKTGGNFVVKLFQSDELENYRNLLRAAFSRVELLRPKSTRKQSFEIFLIGIGKK